MSISLCSFCIYCSINCYALEFSGAFLLNLSNESAPIPIAVIIITASTNLSDGLNLSSENELAHKVIHKNKEPIKATNGLIEVTQRSSLKRSMIHSLKFMIFDLFVF